MSLPEALLTLSGLAYFAFAAVPETCTYQMSKAVERVVFLLAGLLVLFGPHFPVLCFPMGVCYVLALSLSYLGYVTWRVRWSDKPDSVVQVAMWLWDLANTLAPGQVRWTGWVEKDMLPVIFGASDVVLYCNKYATESGALLTAVGYGRCVLANALSPIKEKEAEGALATYSKEGELVMRLEELLQDPTLRHRYEAGARRYAEKNSWEKVARMHLDLYEELL